MTSIILFAILSCYLALELAVRKIIVVSEMKVTTLRIYRISIFVAILSRSVWIYSEHNPIMVHHFSDLSSTYSLLYILQMNFQCIYGTTKVFLSKCSPWKNVRKMTSIKPNTHLISVAFSFLFVISIFNRSC